MRKLKQLLSLAFLLFAQKASSQDKYWIFFGDKSTSVPDKINLIKADDPTMSPTVSWMDLPVKADYLYELKHNQIKVICVSKWLNAVSAILYKEQMESIEKLKYVKAVVKTQVFSKVASLGKINDNSPWDWAFSEINATAFVKQNLSGKNIKIGIIDGGFKGAHQNKYLQQIINAGKIVAMRDFVDPSITELLNPRRPGIGNHGMYVLQMLSGYDAIENKQYGLATNANLYLARTDDENIETHQEEDYWISALEWLDSLGVRLVNSSLGYSHYFDNPLDNYKTSDMNGRSSIIARAAQLAVEKKGMIIVSSIGNEGADSTWQVITTPSDASGVISVGAADIDYWFKPSFSSIGPAFLPYVKPNIACPTADGTSFSAPFITGLIACMLERKPDLTNVEVKDILERSGHLYPYGNNYIGFGLPDAQRILVLLDNPQHDFQRSEEITVTGDSIELDLTKYRTSPKEILTFFFKKDKYNVNIQAISDDDKIVLRRKNNVSRITIASRTKVVEVIWQ